MRRRAAGLPADKHVRRVGAAGLRDPLAVRAGATQIAAGFDHACALLSGGQIDC